VVHLGILDPGLAAGRPAVAALCGSCLLVLFGVTTGRRKEFDWWFRGGAAVLFPAQWERLRSALPAADSLTRSGCPSAYASASVLPQDPPATSQRAIFR
jgi:hypothetical protein